MPRPADSRPDLTYRTRPAQIGEYRARYTEPLALLVAQLAYQGRGGPELAYRFERPRD